MVGSAFQAWEFMSDQLNLLEVQQCWLLFKFNTFTRIYDLHQKYDLQIEIKQMETYINIMVILNMKLEGPIWEGRKY